MIEKFILAAFLFAKTMPPAVFRFQFISQKIHISPRQSQKKQSVGMEKLKWKLLKSDWVVFD